MSITAAMQQHQAFAAFEGNVTCSCYKGRRERQEDIKTPRFNVFQTEASFSYLSAFKLALADFCGGFAAFYAAEKERP